MTSPLRHRFGRDRMRFRIAVIGAVLLFALLTAAQSQPPPSLAAPNSQAPDSVRELTIDLAAYNSVNDLKTALESYPALESLTIRGYNPGILSLDLPYNDLPRLRSLSVEHTNIETISPSIGKCRELSELLLRGNYALRALPDALSGIHTLRSLTFENAQGQLFFPTVIFQCSSLSRLEISLAAGMVGMPDSFGTLKRLESLSITNSFGLRILPPSIGKLTALEELVIAQNWNLGSIPSLAGLSNLRSFTLLGNRKLQEFPAGMASWTKLRALDILGNNIEAIPADIGKLEKLEKLRLADSFEGEYPASLWKLKNLKDLELRTALDVPEEIGQLKGLERLFCASNQQGYPDEIGQLKNLKRLRLSTSAVSIPASIGNLEQLEELEISYCNNLAMLPTSIGDLGSLRELRLISLKKVKGLPIPLSGLRKLEKLLLWDVGLEQIPEGLAACDKLRSVELRSMPALAPVPALKTLGKCPVLCELTILECKGKDYVPALVYVPRLQKLSLRSCSPGQKAEPWENAFAAFGRENELRVLDLRNNGLAAIPSGLQELKRLDSLYLDSNPLILSEPEFGALARTDLKKLSLTNCHFKSIPAGVGNLTSLKSLWLDMNMIETLPGEIGRLEGLLELGLSHQCAGVGDFVPQCAFTELPAEVQLLKGLKLLDLRGNDGISNEQVREWREKLPGARIMTGIQ